MAPWQGAPRNAEHRAMESAVVTTSRVLEGHQIGIRLHRVAAALDGTTGREEGGDEQAPFERVHLGETFCGRLVITSDATFALGGLLAKVEVQSNALRTVVYDDADDAAAPLPPGESRAIAFSLEIAHTGIHVIVATVTYANPVTNERKLARKFFKFSVTNPMALKTKLTRGGARIYLEAQLQNVSDADFYIQSVAFTPARLGGAISCSTIVCGEAAQDGEAAQGGEAARYAFGEGEDCAPPLLLEPECMQQFVFVIWRHEAPAASSSLSVAASDEKEGDEGLGRIDIEWRSARSGERGRLQTGSLSMAAISNAARSVSARSISARSVSARSRAHQLRRPLGTPSAVRVEVRGVPPIVLLDDVIVLSLSVHNGNALAALCDCHLVYDHEGAPPALVLLGCSRIDLAATVEAGESSPWAQASFAAISTAGGGGGGDDAAEDGPLWLAYKCEPLFEGYAYEPVRLALLVQSHAVGAP